MRTYTYTQALRKLARILDRAEREGAVRIRRRDGTNFVVRLERKIPSPFDGPGLDLKIPVAEIVRIVRAGRGPIAPPRRNQRRRAS